MKTKNTTTQTASSVYIKGMKAELRAIKSQKKQEDALKRKQAEAKSRQEVAARWEFMGESMKYKKSAVRESCKRIIADIEETLLDGIIYNLDKHNCNKSVAKQKRILRRIVEKRQAQVVHKIARDMEGKCIAHFVLSATSKCMDAIHKHQFCA